MPNPYEPEGTLPSILRFVDRPGQVVRNMARGRPSSAGRQVVDIFGDLVDTLLPGDLIPSASGPEDYISGSELVGMGDMEPGIARTIADIGVGMATDPLTYVGFGPASKALQAAGKAHSVKLGVPFMKPIAEFGTAQAMDPLSVVGRYADQGITAGAKKVDALTAKGSTIAGKQAAGTLESGYEGLKGGVRRTLGWENLSPAARDQLALAKAAGKTASDVHLKKIQELFKGTTPQERIALTKAHLGIDAGTLDPIKMQQWSKLQGNDVSQRITELSRIYGLDEQKLQRIAAGMGDISTAQWDEMLKTGVATQRLLGAHDAAGVWHDANAVDAMVQNAIASGFRGSKDDFLKQNNLKPSFDYGRDDYLQRGWRFYDDTHGGTPTKGSTPKMVQGTKLDTPQDIADFFNANKDTVGSEMDALQLMTQRASQQGKGITQATLAKNYGFGTIAGKDLIPSAVDTIKKSSLNSDEKIRLVRELEGYGERGGIGKVIAAANRVIKPALVYGVIFPKIGAQVRNKIGQVWQAASTEGVGLSGAGAQLKSGVQDLLRSADEAYAKVLGHPNFIPADDIGRGISDIESAIKQAKTGDEVASILRQQGKADLADAVEYGVMDGFVSTEEIIKDIQRTPKSQRWIDLYDAPGRMFQGVEQRARLREFLRAKQAGTASAEAARNLKDAFLDYSITGPENRALRDIIPFAQFIAQSIPQQAKLLSQKPAVAAGLAPLFTDPSGDNAPIYPWQEGKTNVAVGKTDAGNLLYLSGFGLPVETLESIPNLSADPLKAGRQIQGGPVASMQPILKTGLSAITGEDPYFDTPAFSYGKLPIVGEAGATGRMVNAIAGTGALDPLGYGMVRQAGQLLQDDRPLGARIADVATGAKLTEVDPDLAEQRQINEYLNRRPEVKRYTSFYGDLDTETKQILEELKQSKRRSKMKRDVGVSGE